MCGVLWAHASGFMPLPRTGHDFRGKAFPRGDLLSRTALLSIRTALPSVQTAVPFIQTAVWVVRTAV